MYSYLHSFIPFEAPNKPTAWCLLHRCCRFVSNIIPIFNIYIYKYIIIYMRKFYTYIDTWKKCLQVELHEPHHVWMLRNPLPIKRSSLQKATNAVASVAVQSIRWEGSNHQAFVADLASNHEWFGANSVSEGSVQWIQENSTCLSFCY